MEQRAETAPSLEVFDGDKRIFTHHGRWLHPLFALEEFLLESGAPPERLRLRDRIIGKAAAMLILRMGISEVYGELTSDLAVDYLEARGASIEWGRRVPRIECRTEELFADVDDTEAAYLELRRRAGL